MIGVLDVSSKLFNFNHVVVVVKKVLVLF